MRISRRPHAWEESTIGEPAETEHRYFAHEFEDDPPAYEEAPSYHTKAPQQEPVAIPSDDDVSMHDASSTGTAPSVGQTSQMAFGREMARRHLDAIFEMENRHDFPGWSQAEGLISRAVGDNTSDGLSRPGTPSAQLSGSEGDRQSLIRRIMEEDSDELSDTSSRKDSHSSLQTVWPA